MAHIAICQMNGTQIARDTNAYLKTWKRTILFQVIKFQVIKTQDSNSSETGRDVLEGFDRISKLNVRKKFSNDYHRSLEVLRVSLQVVVAAVGVNVISMSKVGWYSG